MRTPSPLYRMADRLADGKLADRINELRAEGHSLDSVARRLYADFGVEVTRQTVANWCAAMDAETTEAAS